jgi:ferritin
MITILEIRVKMLKKEIFEKLNKQVALEQYSSNMYLSMSSWCKANGFDGASGFLYQHSKEELAHMDKLFNYINETGAQAIIESIEKPPSEYDNLLDIFNQILNHEIHITNEINELVDISLQMKDYSTFNFLQWYVSEQHEEEALFKGIIDKINIIGTDKRGYYLIDKEIRNILNAR